MTYVERRRSYLNLVSRRALLPGTRYCMIYGTVPGTWYIYIFIAVGLWPREGIVGPSASVGLSYRPIIYVYGNLATGSRLATTVPGNYRRNYIAAPIVFCGPTL